MQSHCDDTVLFVRTTVPHSAHAVAHARPTMLHIPLEYASVNSKLVMGQQLIWM